MNRFFNFPFILLLFSSCAILGTKTVYKTSNKFNVQELGFVDFTPYDTIHKILYETGQKVFGSTLIETFKKNGIENCRHLSDKFNFSGPDLNLIRQLCSDNKLDGIIVSGLRFKAASPLDKVDKIQDKQIRSDVYVESKLYDKNANLLLHIKYNTFWGNSYATYPKPERGVIDGTKGAIEKMAKEINMRKKIK